MISSTKNRDTKQNKPQHQGVRKFFTSDGKQTKKQAETSQDLVVIIFQNGFTQKLFE